MRKIRFDILKTAIFGSINTFEENDVIKMRRFTNKQLKFFDETENYIQKFRKGKASSSMNIDFYTDATNISFEFKCYVASSQPYCYTDLYVDGVMMGHFGYSATEEGVIKGDVDLKDGVKRVTIWLPCLFEVNIVHLSMNGKIFESAKKDKNILFFGDSITQGYTSKFPSLTYTNILANTLNANCLNQGIGANLFDADDPDENLPFSPDAVFIAYGTNDWAHSGDRNFEENAKAYLKRICSIYADVKKYVILPIWRGNLEEKGKNAVMTFEEMHVLLENICRNFDVTVIDGMKLVPNMEEFFMSDMTHPSEMGFLHYGHNLIRAVFCN